MRGFLLLIIGCIAWLALPRETTPPALGAEVAVSVARYRSAVVRVRVTGVRDMAYGSGVIIRYRGRKFVLTANHVTAGARKIEVWIPSLFTWRQVPLLHADPLWDLAALDPGEVDDSLAADLPETPAPPGLGAQLEVCGIESGSSTGSVTGYMAPRPGLPADWMVVSRTAKQGDSGCPAFAADGTVSGIVWGTTATDCAATQPVRVQMFLASMQGSAGSCGPAGCGPQGCPVRRLIPVPRRPQQPAPVPVQPPPQVIVNTDPRVAPAIEGLQVGVDAIARNTLPPPPEPAKSEANPLFLVLMVVAGCVGGCVLFFAAKPQ